MLRSLQQQINHMVLVAYYVFKKMMTKTVWFWHVWKNCFAKKFEDKKLSKITSLNGGSGKVEMKAEAIYKLALPIPAVHLFFFQDIGSLKLTNHRLNFAGWIAKDFQQVKKTRMFWWHFWETKYRIPKKHTISWGHSGCSIKQSSLHSTCSPNPSEVDFFTIGKGVWTSSAKMLSWKNVKRN